MSTAVNSVNQLARQSLEAGEGILRLAPTWVPRIYLQPGRRLKLDSRDLYAYGAHRGGMDERWFASTTPAMNDNRTPDEGLSYVVSEGQRFTLKDAVEAEGPRMIGKAMWGTYHRWPVYSKFFDNSGPIMHHLHQSEAQARLVGRGRQAGRLLFSAPVECNLRQFSQYLLGLEPGSTKEDVRKCLERWDEGDNGILDFAKAYRLEPGTGGWCRQEYLHAPGSLLTYEPQWGSDVLAMFQSMVEGRPVPRSLMTQDVPEEKHHDLDFLADLVDYAANL